MNQSILSDKVNLNRYKHLSAKMILPKCRSHSFTFAKLC